MWPTAVRIYLQWCLPMWISYEKFDITFMKQQNCEEYKVFLWVDLISLFKHPFSPLLPSCFRFASHSTSMDLYSIVHILKLILQLSSGDVLSNKHIRYLNFSRKLQWETYLEIQQVNFEFSQHLLIACLVPYAFCYLRRKRLMVEWLNFKVHMRKMRASPS